MVATGVDAVIARDLALGRRIKVALVALVAVGVVWVLIAGHFWHHLGRITVLPARAGDRVEVDVSSPAHRAGLADLTAVAETSDGRTLRIQADVGVPARGEAHAAFGFAPLLTGEEQLTSFKVQECSAS